MCEVKLLKSNQIMPAIKGLIHDGKGVRITVTGMSMYPFLRGNKDSVELIKVDYKKLKKGDIVLIRRTNNQYVLHRIISKKRKYFYINGDAQQWWEGPIYPEQVIAKVNRVWRKDTCINCSNMGWRLVSFLWRIVLPFRYFIIKTYGFMRKFIRSKVRSTVS